MPGATANWRQTGFTLIELLIVLVIVAVLAAIAYPSYTAYTKRSVRADAKAELLRMQLVVEKQRLLKIGSPPVCRTIGWPHLPSPNIISWLFRPRVRRTTR